MAKKVDEMLKEGMDSKEIDKAIEEEWGESEFAGSLRRLDEIRSVEAGEPIKPRKVTTSPWRNQPWARDLLGLEKKRAGFYCRWFAADEISSAIARRWRFCDRKHYGGTTEMVPGEESRNGTKIVRREMTLMEVPQRWKNDWDRFRYEERMDRRKRPSRLATNLDSQGFDDALMKRLEGGFQTDDSRVQKPAPVEEE
jgi:hypothetical protein